MQEIQIMFVIGIPTMSADDLENVDHKVQKQIENEFQKFGDILQVETRQVLDLFSRTMQELVLK